MEYAKVIDLIRSRVDIVDFIGERVRLFKSGSSYKGLCPFHAEKTASFFVNPSQGFFYCFGCKKGGDVIKFLMDIEKFSYDSAVKFLCSRMGVLYEDVKRPTEFRGGVQNREIVSRICSLNARLVRFFLSSSCNNKEVLDYVLKERNISEEVVSVFGVGYLRCDVEGGFSFYNFLVSKGYSAETLSESGLFSRKRQNFSILSGRLIFPIRDFKGNVVGFGGRSLGVGNGPKYINLSETVAFKKRELLYGFYEGFSVIKENKSVILTEGYMDVLAFFTAGVKIAVSTLGTSFSREHLALIRRYADKITICFDGDDAGLLATFKAYQICLPFNIDVDVIKMEYGFDPADVLKSRGASYLGGLVGNECDAFEYLLERYSAKYDLSKTSGLNNMIGIFIKLISLSGTNAQRDILLEKLESRVGIRLETLRQDYYDVRERNAIENSKKSSSSYQTNTYERYLVVALLKDFSYFNIIRRNISDSDLHDVDVRRVFLCFENLFDNNEIFSLLNLKEVLRDRYGVSEVFFEDMLRIEFEVDNEMVMQILFAIKKRKLEDRVLAFKEMTENSSLVGARTQIRELMFLNVQRESLRIYLNG
ncbi:DNA primase [Borrelia sp. P9F1]|uniref:DNA primase n=1 Tax=Borrelia sp. P9F1 TaxID=3058374 RepID=UPI002648A632|nr:DNA primase [Borrelia sp. P9F1]WKC58247.1 DNA primase [Borrelia sp. P9F1]